LPGRRTGRWTISWRKTGLDLDVATAPRQNDGSTQAPGQPEVHGASSEGRRACLFAANRHRRDRGPCLKSIAAAWDCTVAMRCAPSKRRSNIVPRGRRSAAQAAVQVRRSLQRHKQLPRTGRPGKQNPARMTGLPVPEAGFRSLVTRRRRRRHRSSVLRLGRAVWCCLCAVAARRTGGRRSSAGVCLLHVYCTTGCSLAYMRGGTEPVGIRVRRRLRICWFVWPSPCRYPLQ
jgi:hypothetical protein